jgi:hypothetical protein
MIRRKCLAVAVMCLPLFMATTVASQEINACMNKRSGALRIVSDQSKCKKTETFMSWNQKGPGVHEAYDASEKYLGTIVSTSGKTITIYIPSLKKFVNFSLFTGEILYSDFWYSGTGCSGQPFLASSDIICRSNDGKLYYGSYPSSHEVFKSRSVANLDLRYGTIGSTCQEEPGGPDSEVFQTAELLEGELPFTVPVSLPLQFK